MDSNHRDAGARSVAQMGRELSQLRDRIVREADVRPFRTAGLAVATGYLLGGGLFSKLTARLVGTGLRIGLRVAFIPFVTQSLAAWGEDLLRSRPSGPEVTRRGHDEPPVSAGGGPFAADTSSGSSASSGAGSPSSSSTTSIPRKPARSTDPKENNP